MAERKNRTVVEMARSMLKAKNLPNSFWAEAVATTVHLLNISPTKAVWNHTPFEAWYDKKPVVSNLRIFGSIADAHVSAEKRQKLDDKSVKCIFIGYSEESKAYHLYNPLTQQIYVNRDVIFDENSCWNWHKIEQVTPTVAVDLHSSRMNTVETPPASQNTEGNSYARNHLHGPLESDSSNEQDARKVRSLIDI